MLLSVSQSAECQFVRRHSGNTDWRLHRGFEELDLPTLVSKVVFGDDSTERTVVKTGRHRTVYRVPTKAGNVFLKHYRACDWSNWLQNVVRKTKAEREWTGINTIRRFGINTVEPIALGVQTNGGLPGDSFVVTREVEQTVPLDEFLENGRADSMPMLMQSDIIEQLASITATLHNNGLIHRDYHAGNFLVKNDSQSVELFLLDLHPLSAVPSMSVRQTEQMIGQLNHFISRFATRTDRLRFFNDYWFYLSSQCRDLYYQIGLTRKEIVREVEERCQQIQTSSWARADRKWRRGNRRLLIHKNRNVHARCVAALGKDFLKQLSNDADCLFDQPFQLDWIKQSEHRKVSRVGFPTHGAMHHAYYKMQTVGRSREFLFRFQGGSHVRQAWEFGHALLRRGIPTPKPLAFVERKQGSKSRHYLLTEAANNSVALSAFYDVYLREMKLDEAHRWLNRHAKSLGNVIAKLHVARFDHRDLKSNNIMVSNDFTLTQPLLLDLDAVRRWPVLPRVRVVQNLARMNRSTLDCPVVSLTHRLRFLKNYLGKDFSSDWKKLWGDISDRMEFTQVVSREKAKQPRSIQEAA